MNVARYQTIIYLQFMLLFVDLFLNTFSEMLRFENVILLVLYVIQDMCILFAVIIVFLLFFNTYIFQAGLVNVLVNKFRATIIVVFIYLVLCITLHVWGLTLRWHNTQMYMYFNNGYTALYVLQRTAAVFYYYFYKRTALQLGDPRYYQDSNWIRAEFEKRR